MQHAYSHPVKEILPETPFGNLCHQVSMRGGYQPYIDALLYPTHRRTDALLQHPEQPYLHIKLIKKQGAPVRLLKDPGPVCNGTSESALLVAKQSGVDQLGRLLPDQSQE
jgi:hypothetical protein